MPQTRKTLPGQGATPLVSAARNCLRVLQAFVHLPREVPLRAVSDWTGLNKSTTYRALQSLMAEGFVDQDPVTRHYRLGIAALELGACFMRSTELGEVARPFLARLVDQLGESVTLAVRQGDEAIFIDKVTAPHPVAFFCDVGRRLPLHAGAAAKAILAWLPAEERMAYLSRPLTALTPYTVTDRALLDRQLAEIRLSGISVSNQEVDVGVSAIGAPIFAADGSVAGGLAVAGLTARFTPEYIESHAEVVRQIAWEISKNLGCRTLPVAQPLVSR